jgi:hypothetical protein
MNTPSNAGLQAGLDTQGVAPAVLSPTRPLYWSIRRELWEYRSIYIAPLAAAAVFLAGFLVSTIRLPQKMRDLAGLDPMRQQQLIQQPYVFAALLIMGATFVVAFFYCLDTLQGERRDRSILFWKSLPVSDLTTVLSKAAIVLVVIPLLTFAISAVTIWVMYLISTLVLAGSGVGAATLWSRLPLGQMTATLLYHLVFIHGLWYAQRAGKSGAEHFAFRFHPELSDSRHAFEPRAHRRSYVDGSARHAAAGGVVRAPRPVDRPDLRRDFPRPGGTPAASSRAAVIPSDGAACSRTR